jgi:metallo-beta-lactamase family protein
LLPAPKAPERADILIIESTYGDRLHEDRRSRRQRLQQVIEQALADKGSVLIPAFSIGRTQELLYELEDILHEHPDFADRRRGTLEGSDEAIDWNSLPIILDSPLASRFTQVYRELAPFWDGEALARVREGRKPLSFANLLTVDSHQAHLAMVKRLAETAQPAIVIAAGGMCAGGRIVDYLKAMLHDSRHDVLFVGYQAQGTPGHAIQTYGPKGGYVLLDEVRYNVGAKISTIGGYSAHADQQGLVDFVTQMTKWPSKIRIVHGDNAAKSALAVRYQALYRQANQAVEITIPGVVGL